MLVSILAPVYYKRMLAEFLCITMLLSIPMLWKSWELPMSYSTGFMVDKLSGILMILSLWTCILMVLLKPSDKFLSLNMILLLLSLLYFFSVSSLLSFFILFEASLIPTLCLIMGWGYQPERLEASYYFIFYTITFSIPLLVSLMWLSSTSGSKFFYYDNFYEICSGVMGLLILCVFLIKLPLFLVHFWLPKAHVEAPVVGSMILAGVLLKTGGYGIARVFMYMKKSLVSISFMALGLTGMVCVCLVCLYCTDLKQMIAFSSVSHMNFMIIGLMNNSQTPFGGSVIMMVSHGLCSSLMFMLADLSYSRCNSRSILINKGFLMVMPPLASFWGFTILFNMGVPPSAASISELMIISVSTQLTTFNLMFGLYLFFSAFYSVYLYVSVSHGNSQVLSFNVQIKESLVGIAHLLPLASLTLLTKLMLI